MWKMKDIKIIKERFNKHWAGVGPSFSRVIYKSLERVSLCEFRDKFIFKSEMLIAAIAGVDLRY